VSTINRKLSSSFKSASLFESDTTIFADYEITSGKNALTAGPVTINSGVTVTVPTGARWVIV